MHIGDFELLEPLRVQPGLLEARAIRMGVPALVRVAHPPTRLVQAHSSFAGAAAEFFGPGAPGCPVRFEARLLARLRVPGVPALLASGTHLGAPWLARAWAPGPLLSAVVPLEDGAGRALAAGLLTVLAALHGQGVVHRNLTAEGIALGTDGPWLLDLGLAAAEEAIPGRVGRVAAPEVIARALGAPVLVDHRVDLYALGHVLADAVPRPSAPLARLIEALRAPLHSRPISAEAALAILEGGPWQRAPAPTRFAEALGSGDPEAALRLTRDARVVGHLAAALGRTAQAQAALAALGPAPRQSPTEKPNPSDGLERPARRVATDRALVEARLALAAGAPEQAAEALRSAVAAATDPAVLAVVTELALDAGEPELAVAAAVRAVAFRPGEGADLLRHVTGRLLVQETLGPSVRIAGALVSACVAQGLVGLLVEPPAVVLRSFERAAELGRSTLASARPDPTAVVLLATAGWALDAAWLPAVLALARRLATEDDLGELLEITEDSLVSLAARALGLSPLGPRWHVALSRLRGRSAGRQTPPGQA